MEHLNVNMCVLEICMVWAMRFIECKCANLWSLDVSGGVTGIEPLTGRGHLKGGPGRWFPVPSSIM